MQRLSGIRRFLAATLTCLLFGSASIADPLHRFSKEDAYWHHGSGWVFPRIVASFVLEGTPGQIDGNEDVTSTYVMVSRDQRRTATLDVYLPDSAAVGAKLSTAKAAAEARANAGKCGVTSSEKRYVVGRQPQIVGVEVSFIPGAGAGADCSRSTLYFFPTTHWVITVRGMAAASDADAAASLREFVEALRWDTLDTDPFLQSAQP